MDRRYRSRDWLLHQYESLGRNLTSIATECGVSRPVIADWVNRFSSTRQIRCQISKDVLYQLYEVEHKSLQEIGIQLNYSRDTYTIGNEEIWY